MFDFLNRLNWVNSLSTKFVAAPVSTSEARQFEIKSINNKYFQMNFELVKASSEHKEIFTNLMQFYYYDFSEYLKFDTESHGLFKSYPNLEEYWNNDGDKFPYIVMSGTNYAGFVLVRYICSEPRNHFSIAEFFVLRKYRREGIGKAIAFEIFNLHRGRWEVYQRDSNKPAQMFWKSTIAEYTKGRFDELIENERSIQRFENTE